MWYFIFNHARFVFKILYHAEFEASMGGTCTPHGEGASHHRSLLYPSFGCIAALANVDLCSFTIEPKECLLHTDKLDDTCIFEKLHAGMFAAC
jgi:hypothetical protein